jgi:hypothetical protein
MRLFDRWHAFWRIGEAVTRVAERSAMRRLAQEEAERAVRLGDIDGQTSRAMAFADRLEGAGLVGVRDSATVTPQGWNRGL